jgi:hypothetical protein
MGTRARAVGLDCRCLVGEGCIIVGVDVIDVIGAEVRRCDAWETGREGAGLWKNRADWFVVGAPWHLALRIGIQPESMIER